MSAIQIVCANCGAKYRIPPTFKGDKAKCKQCGTVIDVTSQRHKAAPAGDAGGGGADRAEKPAGARPASAKPASAKPASARPAAAKPAGARPARARTERATSSARRSGRKGEADPTAEQAPRRGARGRKSRRGADAGAPEPKGTAALWIGGGILVAAVVVVGLVFMLGGDGDGGAGNATSEQTAKADSASAAGTDSPGGEQANAGAEPTAGRPDEATADPDTAQPADADAQNEPKPAPTAKPRSTGVLSRELHSREDVFNPKVELEPVAWPDYVTDEEKQEVRKHLDAIRDQEFGYKSSVTALEELGHKSLAGIINELREIDYFDSWQSAYAYELNRLLEAMAIGINAGYKPTNIGDDVPLDVAHKNAICAMTWQRLLTRLYPDPESWERMRKSRTTRHVGK